MSNDAVLSECDAHGVLRLTLNDPGSHNALSAHMMGALHTALDAAHGDGAVRVVVIQATGAAFCSGHHLKDMLHHNEFEAHQALFAQCSRLMQRIASLAVPVIAQVQGLATAAGCQLVAQCDLAVASRQARFAASGVNLGLFCATPSVALSRNLGRKAAMAMLLTGEFMGADEALAMGLLNEVVAPGDLTQAVDGWCAKLTNKPRDVLALGKALFYQQLEMGTAAAYQLAGHTMAVNMMQASAQEGVTAFVDKRLPKW